MAVRTRALVECVLIEGTRVLALRSAREPSRTRDTFLVYETMHDVFGDDEKMLDSGEACVFFGRAAVNV
jgi:hypothetical protein